MQNNQQNNNTQLILYGVLGLMGFYFIKQFFALGASILERFGLVKDPATKALVVKTDNMVKTEEALGDNSPWSFRYWQLKNPATYLVSDPNISSYMYWVADDMYESIGYIYDQPQRLVGDFKKLNSKMSVSVVASAFMTKFNKPLLQYIVSSLDTPEQLKALDQIMTYVNSLPVTVAGQ